MAASLTVESDLLASPPDNDPVVSKAVDDFCTPIRTSRPQSEIDLLKSGRTFRLSNGIAGVAWGSGPAVLLVHGWCGRSTQMSGFVSPLLEAGYSVEAIDCWGHGDSPGKQSHGVAFVEGIMLASKEHGPYAAVIAHSLGAAATLIALGKGINVGRAVLLAPPELRTVTRRFAAKKKLSEQEQRAFTPALERKVGMHEEDFLLEQVAKNIHTPVMLIHDSADREVPVDDVLGIVQNLNQGSLIQVSGCGHLLLLKSAEVIKNAVNFIAQTEHS